MKLYIDPGTGSMLFAILIGIIGALNFALRGWIIKLRFLLSGGEKTAVDLEKHPLAVFVDDKRYWNVMEPVCRELDRRGLDVGPGVGLLPLQYVFHKTAVLLYATVLLLAGRPWIAAHSDGVLRYLPGAYAVVAGVIVGLIALCALPVVQRLARWLLHFLPNTGRWAERRESWLKQLDTLSTESRHLLADKPRCAAILGVHLVKLFLLFCLPWMGLRFMELDTGLAFWQVQLLTSLTLFVSNALPNVAGMGSVETAFLLVYSSFLPDASSMSLLMFYRLASYYAVFAASAVGFALAQRSLSRE